MGESKLRLFASCMAFLPFPFTNKKPSFYGAFDTLNQQLKWPPNEGTHDLKDGSKFCS